MENDADDFLEADEDEDEEDSNDEVSSSSNASHQKPLTFKKVQKSNLELKIQETQ